MHSLIITLLMTLFASAVLAETQYDKLEELNGVALKTKKVQSIRSFIGTTEKTFPYSLSLVKKGVTNFSEKCNNSYREKRTFTSEKENCKYHNEHLIESFVVKDIKRVEPVLEFNEIYLLGRLVYNRGHFGYYELVTIQNGINQTNQKTTTITLRMLDDKEVKQYISPKITKESAFDQSLSTFTLTEISPQETHLKYEYSATTDHWLLNKEVSVPQVFASISKSINDLVQTVESESSLQKRELASQN